MREFIKSTVVGGVVFLLPVVLVLVMLGYAVQLVSGIAGPVLEFVGLENYGTMQGLGIVTAASIVILIVIAFVAGFIARTTIGSRLTDWLEKAILNRLPQYQMMKSMAGSFATLHSQAGLSPALIAVEGVWRIGYRLETLENGWEAVFLPQSPGTMSGVVAYVPVDRVRPLSISMAEATSLVQQMGLGSRAVLKDVTMAAPTS